MNQLVTTEKSMLPGVALGFLLLFLFFLPLYEAPKNIFSVFFVFLGGWIVLRHQHPMEFCRKKSLVVWAFLLFALSPFIAGLNSPYMEVSERISTALNWALMPFVALIFLLIHVSKKQLLWALRVLSCGTVIAVTQAFYDWVGRYPELNSVGHVNQSALYLAMSLVPAGLLFLNRENLMDLALVIACVISVMYYQGPARSLVGFGTSMLVLAGFWLIYCVSRGYLKILVSSVFLGIILSIVAVSTPPSFFGSYQGLKQEFDSRMSSNRDLFSQRGRLANAALEVSGHSVTGYGIGSFGRVVTKKNVKASVQGRGGDWRVERRNYFYSNHGHSLFANILVERGWIGVSIFGSFLSVVLLIFVRNIEQQSSQVGVLTILIIFFAGLGQTVLHVEHGALSLINIALCFLLTRSDNND